MASAGLTDVGGQIVFASQFHGVNLGVVDASRWTNGGGDTGKTQRIDTNRLDLITGTTLNFNSFIWQTQQLRDPSQGVLALVVPSPASVVLVARAASTTWQTLTAIPNSSYGAQLTSAGTLNLLKTVGTVISTIGTLANAVTIAGGIRYWVRFECVGHHIRAKAWDESKAEPANWQLDVVDTTNMGPGALALGAITTAAATQEGLFHEYISYIPSPSMSMLPIILQGLRRQTLTATSTGTPSIVKLVNKILATSSTGTATLVKLVNKITSVTSTGSATLTKVMIFLRSTLSVTSTGTPTTVRLVNKTMAVTSTTVAAITRVVQKVISAASGGTSSIIKLVSKTLAATSTGTATMVRVTSKVLAATSTGAATMVRLINKTLNAASSGLASLATVFISGGGGGAVFQQVLSVTSTGAATFTKLVKKNMTAAAKRAAIFMFDD